MRKNSAIPQLALLDAGYAQPPKAGLPNNLQPYAMISAPSDCPPLGQRGIPLSFGGPIHIDDKAIRCQLLQPEHVSLNQAVADKEYAFESVDEKVWIVESREELAHGWRQARHRNPNQGHPLAQLARSS